MAAVSLTTLRARARERADMTNSQFVTDAATSLDALLNEGAQTLHALLAEKFKDYCVSSSALNTVAGTTSYALPTGFFKLLGIDLTLNGQSIDLDPFNFKERNAFKTATSRAYTATLPRYRIVGSNLWLYPAPDAVYTGTIWFVPQLQVLQGGSGSTYINLLTSATDTVDFPNGWERFIVLYAAVAMLKKEESDAGPLEGELLRLKQEIEAEAEYRDLGNPHQVVDVEASVIDPRRIR